MRAAWKNMLEGARDEALLAVDLYNQPRRARRLEAFLIHMHIAWLYLLQARLKRTGIDFRYRLSNGRFERIDGEPKTWDLQRCVAERWPGRGAVRSNLELSIALRNKIEHRYEEAITLVTSGYAQALVLNFESEVIETFGLQYSLAEQLRFPIFVGDVTALGAAKFKELREQLPRTTRDTIARFETDLDQNILVDQRYEFRVNLIPKTGPKGEADRAFTFVRYDDLDPEGKKAYQKLGQAGQVVVREQIRSVSNSDKLKPSQVASLVQEQSSFRIRVNHVVTAWKKLGCRPSGGDPNPERTKSQYCLYDKPHKDYVYTSVFVDRLTKAAEDSNSFREFFGVEPIAKEAD